MRAPSAWPAAARALRGKSAKILRRLCHLVNAPWHAADVGDAGDGVQPDSDGQQPLRRPDPTGVPQPARSEADHGVALPGARHGTGNGGTSDTVTPDQGTQNPGVQNPGTQNPGFSPFAATTTATGNGARSAPLVLHLAPRAGDVKDAPDQPGDGPGRSTPPPPSAPANGGARSDVPAPPPAPPAVGITNGNADPTPADSERTDEVDAARRRATPAIVGEWRPPVQRHTSSDTFDRLVPGGTGTNGVRYGGGLPALATLTVIDTSEPLVERPSRAAARDKATSSRRTAPSSNGATSNGAGSPDGLTAAALTVASPATSNGRLWRQIERSPWDAPAGEPVDARSHLRFTVRSGTDGYPLDDVDNFPLQRRGRRRRRRVIAAIIVMVALIAAAIAWIVVSGTSESATGDERSAPPAPSTVPSGDDLADAAVVPTPTAPSVARSDATAAEAGDGDTTAAADAGDGAGADGIDVDATTGTDETDADESSSGAAGADDGSVLDGTDPDGGDADAGETDSATGGTTGDDLDDGDADTTSPTPAVGFATINDAEGRVVNACTSFPFDPVSADYQLFSFLVQTSTDRWIVDRWFDADIDGIFVHRLGSDVVSTGSATDGPEIIDGAADGIDVVINPPASAFEECRYVVRTSPTDLESAPYTQAILDSCVVNDGAVNRVVAELTEGGHVDVTDRSDGTAEIRYDDDDLDAALVEPDGQRAIDGTVATWSGLVANDTDAQLIEVIADTADLPACAPEQL